METNGHSSFFFKSHTMEAGLNCSSFQFEDPNRSQNNCLQEKGRPTINYCSNKDLTC